MKLAPADFRRLLAAARRAQRRAYAPYSRFKVGAAVLTVSGKIFTGGNIENASYGLTLCAERVAVAQAVSAGQRRFKALAIVTSAAGATPCGACRQVLAEFGDCVILCAATGRRQVQQLRLAELLPRAFRF